jgi:hypothetical protein
VRLDAKHPWSPKARLAKGRVTMVAWITGGGIIYFVLLVTLGILSIRKGHWVMFLVGLVLPIFWLIGALMPRSRH